MPTPTLKDLKEAGDEVTANKNVLTDFISAQLVEPRQPEQPYISAGDAVAQSFETKRIVERQCYSHLLPLCEAKLEEGKNVSVEGTPGIGKTVFGMFILRSFVEKKRSVVYWDNTQATLFTQNQEYIKRFDLEETEVLFGETWYWGAWQADQKKLVGFLVVEDIFVIHDPGEGCCFAGTTKLSKKLVIILSFGHALVSKWRTKRDGAPGFKATMPVFPFEEIRDNKANLFFGDVPSDEQLSKLYKRFGGSIRHWFKTTEADAWEELQAKMTVVAENGADIARRSSNHQGSIVHVAVDFDATKAVYPAEESNKFQMSGYFLGSEDLVTQLSNALAEKGRDQLRSFMNGIKGQTGAEAMYGILFEYHAHEVLRRPKIALNLKVVRYDGKNKDQFTTTTIQLEALRTVLEFEGQEAAGITDYGANQDLSLDTYILPTSPTFPTYDSAMVVPGSVVGLPNFERVGLLLQMTVSGATSIRRRPEHSVKHYMRTEMHAALKTLWPKAEPALSVTTFCVPSVCFHPFLFQHEQLKESKDPVSPRNQAEYQFVIEIPEFMSLPPSDVKKDTIHGASGRFHRFNLRSRRPQKRKRVEDVHQTEASWADVVRSTGKT